MRWSGGSLLERQERDVDDSESAEKQVRDDEFLRDDEPLRVRESTTVPCAPEKDDPQQGEDDEESRVVLRAHRPDERDLTNRFLRDLGARVHRPIRQVRGERRS